MPFYVSAPLPGPLRWSHRIGGRRRPRRGLLYWLFGLWMFELSIRIIAVTVWLLAVAGWWCWHAVVQARRGSGR